MMLDEGWKGSLITWLQQMIFEKLSQKCFVFLVVKHIVFRTSFNVARRASTGLYVWK